MNQEQNVGLLMPKVLYPNGETQYLCKQIPTPFDLIMRRFIPNFIKPLFQARLDAYELKFKDFSMRMEIPNLSGCFMFIRCEALKTVGLFDENFFMYLEDTDLSRRINSQYKTIYYPEASIIHHYEKGSYKNYKLLKYHIQSAFYYFNKWGWLFDPTRSTINNLLK
jgi:GT2 family glycosyltransferase